MCLSQKYFTCKVFYFLLVGQKMTSFFPLPNQPFTIKSYLCGMSKEVLKAAIEEILQAQLTENRPEETKGTIDRLVATGWTEKNARNLVAQCILVELFDMNKHKKPFDMKRYLANLAKLPEKPF
jgi:hypothetical protein